MKAPARRSATQGQLSGALKPLSRLTRLAPPGRPCRPGTARATASGADGSGTALAIITGASRGLGYHLARTLLIYAAPHAALDVLLLARDSRRLAAARDELQAVAGSQCRVACEASDLGDLTDLEALLPSLSRSKAAGGCLPADPAAYRSVLLINNAGSVGELCYVWQQSLRNLKREMDMNVVSPTAITASVVTAFKQSETCVEVLVVNISSISAEKPYEAFSVYAAGKAARAQLAATLGLEAELVHNPRVRAARQARAAARGGTSAATPAGPPVILSLSYAPGAMDTEMQTAAREALPQDAPVKQAFIANKAASRLVDPAESARLLVDFLHGPRSAWANGAHVTVYDLAAAAGQQAATHPLLNPGPAAVAGHT